MRAESRFVVMNSEEPHTIAQGGVARPAFGAQLGAKAFLVVVSSPQFGLLQVLGSEPVTVGRGPGCQVRLDDPTVSSEHCRVSSHPEKGFLIEDCGSTNGTLLNGRRIDRPAELSYGDRIGIGSTIIRFYREEVPDRR